MQAVNLYPKTCNICGGKVIYTTNDVIYGKQYGSGYCYLCAKCRAYVGTHFSHPKQAFGILADEQMRKGKQMCHELFDSFWKGKKNAQSKRDRLYLFLSYELGIPHEQTHFGYFDLIGAMWTISVVGKTANCTKGASATMDLWRENYL